MVDNSIRALIVDDEEPLRGIMRIALGYFGIKVVGEAGNGEEAIEKYNEVNPNVVLMDINMPKMDGLTALGEIIKINPDAIVLMITASDDETAMDRGRQLGARGFLRKPLVMDELHKDILSHLRVQIAKEKGQTLEKDYFKYQIKPGFRPGDEGKHFEGPEITGATRAIRERQRAMASEAGLSDSGPTAEELAQRKAAAAQAPAVPAPAADAPAPPPQAPAPTAPAVQAAPPAQPPITPTPAPQSGGVPVSAAVAAPTAPPPAAPALAPRSSNPDLSASGSYARDGYSSGSSGRARVSSEVADILGREANRQQSELELARAEIQRLKRALAEASDKLRQVADDLSRSAK